MGGAWVQRKHRYQESWTEIWSDLCITSLDMNDSKYIYYCSLTIFDHIGFTSVQKHAQIMCSGLHGISSHNLHMKRRVFLRAQINHLTKCRAHDTLGDSAWLPSGYKWLRKWVSQYSKCVRVSESACTSLTSLTHRPLPFPFARYKNTFLKSISAHISRLYVHRLTFVISAPK